MKTVYFLTRSHFPASLCIILLMLFGSTFLKGTRQFSRDTQLSPRRRAFVVSFRCVCYFVHPINVSEGRLSLRHTCVYDVIQLRWSHTSLNRVQHKQHQNHHDGGLLNHKICKSERWKKKCIRYLKWIWLDQVWDGLYCVTGIIRCIVWFALSFWSVCENTPRVSNTHTLILSGSLPPLIGSLGNRSDEILTLTAFTLVLISAWLTADRDRVCVLQCVCVSVFC